MATSAALQRALAGAAPAPSALRKLLAAAGDLKTQRAILRALSGDPETTAGFLRLARSALRGRRFNTASEAVPLLGENLSTRLALLASSAQWLALLLQQSGLLAPLLRHSVAAAVAAEPLARDSRTLEPLLAYSLALLHHVGEAAALSTDPASLGEVRASDLGAELLRSAGAPPTVYETIAEYDLRAKGRRPGLHSVLGLLSSADYVATALGYAAPSIFSAPQPGERLKVQVAALVESSRRLTTSVEDAVFALLEKSSDRARSSQPMADMAPVLMPDAEGVSIRDLGPLPVLFARVQCANDEDSLIAALTAGIVEEFGAVRAWFLRLDPSQQLRGGMLCARNQSPFALTDVQMPMARLPAPLRNAMPLGRPLLFESRGYGLEALQSSPDAPVFIVPVIAGKEVLGLLGCEMDDDSTTLPDVCVAVAAHAALALKALEFKRQSDAALTDELTGLYNRRGILDALDRVFAQPDLDSRELAVAIIDCDHLKKVNDNFGHLFGDEFVRRISEVVRLSLRQTDELGRYGGDEFLAILPDTSLEQAQQVIERARERVELAGLSSEDGLLLSVSIGAAVRGKSGATREQLIKLADNALYRVKQEGRNAVLVVDAEHAPISSL